MEAMNIREFVTEKVNNLPKKRRFIWGDEEFERDIDIESIISHLELVSSELVYRMTQEEIDDNLESYSDYYENLQPGDIVYYDGEVPFPIDALDTWINEIENSWRKGEIDATDSDLWNYITYLYAQELADQLQNKSNIEEI